jgi:NAD-dependent SIR2 family protein deacetylase
MDPRDRLRARLVGSSCTACGAPTPPDRIRFLARRDELVFVRVGCNACGSEALAIVTLEGDDPEGHLRTDVGSYGEFGPMDEARFATARPVASHDVISMRDFLSGFHGGLRSIIRGCGQADGDGSGASL